MKLRTRITILFSIIVSVILITFSIIIYSLLSNFRHDEFLNRLKDKALTTVKLLSDVDEVNHELLKIIEENTAIPMPQQKILIYDANDFSLVFSNPQAEGTGIDPVILKRIQRFKEITYEVEKVEYAGILFKGKYDTYIAVASAYDKFGYTKLNYLRNIFFIGDFIAVALIVVIGLFFSRQALQPISNMVNQMDSVSVNNLSQRVDEGNTKDEIAQLAVKFNKMLERLDQAFELQRSFVSNASHELRTPLTVLTGQLEVTLMNFEEKNPAKEILTNLLIEIKQLNKLSNGLLDLAQASLDISQIEMTEIRIDELLGISRAELHKRNSAYQVVIKFDDFPEENFLMLYANEQLLKSAFVNVMENSCKYSHDNQCVIELYFDDSFVSIAFKDFGQGILPQDLPFVFEPFFRSENAKHKNGHGVGLALTKKIVELHQGTIVIESEVNKGTTVRISIPHL